MEVTPSASYSVTLRVELANRPGMLGKLTSRIGELGGDIGAVDIVSVEQGRMVRDLTINCRDNEHAKSLVDAIGALDGARLVHHSDRTFLLHLGGKIEVVSRAPIRTRDDLSMVYTTSPRPHPRHDQRRVFCPHETESHPDQYVSW